MSEAEPVVPNLYEIWQKVLSILKDEVSPVSYETWILSLIPRGVRDNNFVLETYAAFPKEMIESRHLDLIRSAVRMVSRTAYDVLITLPESLNTKDPYQSVSEIYDTDQYGNLNPKYTFDSFVIGNGNRLAHAAAVAVSENPAGAYNPFFIYGGVGLGKTHLMHAIAFEILNRNRNSKVLYVSSETFTNELINAIKHNTNEAFRRKYRNIDVLLIDDIQFVSEKESTQEEFFHTFNTLHDANKQIIISSDRPPKEMKTLEERLSSRFKQGLVADVKAPDYETRIAILRKKAERDKIIISDEILEYIAKNVISNIRELEGALTKLDAYTKLVENNLTLTRVEAILKDVFSDNIARVINAELIISIISNYYGVTPEEIRSPKRSRAISRPRQIAMYFCRKLTDLSFEQIGDCFGGRDHTTVMHGCDKITEELEADADLQGTFRELEKKIKG